MVYAFMIKFHDEGVNSGDLRSCTCKRIRHYYLTLLQNLKKLKMPNKSLALFFFQSIKSIDANSGNDEAIKS
jgi:hypothetical protein